MMSETARGDSGQSGIVLLPEPGERPQEAAVWPRTKSLRPQRSVPLASSKARVVGIARLVVAFGAIVVVTKP